VPILPRLERKTRLVLLAEIQEAGVRELAGRHGEGEAIEILSDWNRSGREEKTHPRADYRRLLRSPGAGALPREDGGARVESSDRATIRR
jgi:hypothetical protein